MYRLSVPAVAVMLSALTVSSALAQVPTAGAAGAGNSAISGIPNGPANPSVLSDPSGIGNAARIPSVGSNAPVPQTSYGSLTGQSAPAARSRVVTPSYTESTSRFSARSVGRRSPNSRGRRQTSSFTGICRGC